MSFPRYPEYKDSGVEWLGEVPAHWDVVQFKQFVDIQNGSDHKHVEQADGYPVLGSGGVFTYASDFLHDGESVLLGRKGTIDKPLHITGRFWTVDTMYWTKINSGTSGRFTYYSALTIPFDYYSTNTALPSMTKGALNSHLVVRPPLSEQIQIATFLDRETTKIDELVAEQRRLMELLKEKRQAVISHAVTKGLNPDAPMKPSGIEWLGEVPAHWRVGKCGFYLSILSGFAFPSAGFSNDSADTKLLRGINVGVSRLKWDETVYWRRLPDDGLDIYELQDGDLVIGMDRPLISEGIRVAKVTENDLPCLLLQRVALLKTGDHLDGNYLFGLLSSEMFVAHFSPDTTGVSVPHISPEQINNFVIPVPPIAEQQAIVTLVRIETEKFNTLTAEAQRAIDLLQERRTALISAAVTGQIDVRQLTEKQAA